MTEREMGELTPAWERAARVAQRVHMVRKPKPFRRVLSCCPRMYPDLWTGGKCVYKIEPVVADGGELIVYAPHVRCFSEVHQAAVEALGYHVRDFFLAHMERYAHLPRGVMAYAIIVKGTGPMSAAWRRRASASLSPHKSRARLAWLPVSATSIRPRSTRKRGAIGRRKGCCLLKTPESCCIAWRKKERDHVVAG